jgi:hypothetical protein
MPQDQAPDTLAVCAQAVVTSPAGVSIRPMEPADAGQVLAVYQAGLDTGLASFETTAPSWEAFDAAKLPGHRFIAADGEGVVYASSMVILYAARHRLPVPGLAQWMLALGIVASLAVNVAQGWSHGLVGAVVAAWPAVALVGAYELLA